jgi:hypothetical protein
VTAEQAYRLALRAYPRRWREHRTDEVLGVLMQSHDNEAAGRAAVAARAASLAAHGLLARAGAAGAGLGEEAKQATALVALASLAAVALSCLLFGELWPWHRDAALPAGTPASSYEGTVGPFFTVGGPLMLAVLVVVALALAGRARAARRLLAVLLPLFVLVPAVAGAAGANRPAAWAVAALVIFGFLAGIAPVRRPGWLLAATCALAAACVYPVAHGLAYASDPRPFFYYAPVGTAASVVVVLVAVATVVALLRSRTAAVPAALIGAAWLFTAAVRAHSGLRPLHVVQLFVVAAAALLGVAAWHTTAHARSSPQRG